MEAEIEQMRIKVLEQYKGIKNLLLLAKEDGRYVEPQLRIIDEYIKKWSTS